VGRRHGKRERRNGRKMPREARELPWTQPAVAQEPMALPVPLPASTPSFGAPVEVKRKLSPLQLAIICVVAAAVARSSPSSTDRRGVDPRFTR